MPYSNIGDLPDEVRSRYSPRCQKVFMDAFNRAVSSAGIGGSQDEASAMKVAHTAAGFCKDSGKAEPMKAQALDAEGMEAWFDGRTPRRLLVIPFGGPIPSADGKGRDMDLEYFDEKTDIKPDWFTRRPADWHHSQDPTGLLNGTLIGHVDRLGNEKGELGAPDDYGWWADFWFQAGERRIRAVRQLALQKGAELFGSSYAYPNLVKRGKAGHLDVWPYMMQTLSTSPQNINSIHRPAKAALDLFDQADITVEPLLRDVLTELETLRDLPATFPMGSEQAAKAGRELSGANLAEIEKWLEVLESITKEARSLRDRVTAKYQKPEGVPST